MAEQTPEANPGHDQDHQQDQNKDGQGDPKDAPRSKSRRGFIIMGDVEILVRGAFLCYWHSSL